jgi:hypothetical protein
MAGAVQDRQVVGRALRGAFVLVALALAPRAVRAQQWTEVGKTSVGNPVSVAMKTVSRAKDGIVTATVRAVFVKPVKTARGELKASRTVVMIDCAKHVIAVKENTYYFDEGMTKVYEKTAPKIPGYASPIKGTLPDIAMAALCK